ncbi:MAG: hypothetical protein CR991_00885 [Proteobacteria bacterium]|nr:MAG: hypothetical protein CR991_00885 [Pseudomonadota bacterium]
MKNLFYVFISLLGGAIIPLQLAMVQAFRNTTHATQIQATFYLYLGGMVASFFLSFILSGNIKPPIASGASWWMWLTGFVGVFYILFMFISAPLWRKSSEIKPVSRMFMHWEKTCSGDIAVSTAISARSAKPF